MSSSNQESVIAVGERVYLRRPVKDDLDSYYGWYRDPEIQKYMANPHWDPQRSKDRYREIFVRRHLLTTGESQSFTICENQEGRAVGVVVSYDIDRGSGMCEIGILIGNPVHRCRGFAKEAIELMLNYLHNRIGICIVRCNIHPENDASIRLFEKCGFRKSGEKQEFGFDLFMYERNIENPTE